MSTKAYIKQQSIVTAIFNINKEINYIYIYIIYQRALSQTEQDPPTQQNLSPNVPKHPINAWFITRKGSGEPSPTPAFHNKYNAFRVFFTGTKGLL